MSITPEPPDLSKWWAYFEDPERVVLTHWHHIDDGTHCEFGHLKFEAYPEQQNPFRRQERWWCPAHRKYLHFQGNLREGEPCNSPRAPVIPPDDPDTVYLG